MLQGNERYIYFSIILEVDLNLYPVGIPLSSVASSSGLKINPDMKLRDCMSAKSLVENICSDLISSTSSGIWASLEISLSSISSVDIVSVATDISVLKCKMIAGDFL